MGRRSLALHRPCRRQPAQPTGFIKAPGPLLLVNFNSTLKPRLQCHVLREALPACCSILNTLSSTHPRAVSSWRAVRPGPLEQDHLGSHQLSTNLLCYLGQDS